MDEELRAIQADLDSVLERLAEYMGSDKLPHITPLPDGGKLTIHDAEPQPSARDDAARVVFQYAASPNSGPLDRAIFETRRARKRMKQSDAKVEDGQGKPAGSLWAAVAALKVWNSAGHPLEHHHMRALWRAAFVFIDRRVEYFGEEEGLTHPKRTVDRKRLLRGFAVCAAWELHSNDPKKYPVDDYLFNLAGEEYHLSGGVVKRAYYSHEGKAMRDELERVYRLELQAMQEKGDDQ